MPLTLSWTEISIRLVLTVIAGCLFGLDRGKHGRAAGLRTTLLVCLAASVAMLQANLLLGTVGKASSSFVVLDLMRLPLGILSGMGFIGAGAIVRRDSLVLGVTTAATLWFVTVVGLCLGGGQLVLGSVAALLGVTVLWVVKRLEDRMRQDHRSTLFLDLEAVGPTDEEIRAVLLEDGCRIAASKVAYSDRAQRREINFDVRWRGPHQENKIPRSLTALAQQPGVRRLEWKSP